MLFEIIACRELEQAKSALSQLQQLVKTIRPEGSSSSSVRSTPIPRKSPTNQSVEPPIESRQRRHTPTDSKSYEEKLNDSRNLRPTYRFDDFEEMINHISIKPRMKQSVSDILSQSIEHLICSH